MSPDNARIADTLNVTVAVIGLTMLSIYSAYQMGRADRDNEIKANYHNSPIPIWAASCRLYYDGKRDCKAYSAPMARPVIEWKRGDFFQKRMEKIK